MKRGTKFVVQTINLSNPKTCVKPKIQRLVSADADSSSDPNRASDYRTLRPVAVKVCSWKDAQSKCPPKFCESPQEPPSLSTNAILCRVAAFFIKGAIVAALICWTCSEGLWGDSTETEDLYCRMTGVIFPERPIRLPHLEEIKYSVFETYNHMLVKGMDIIVSVPREVHRRLQGLLLPCDTTKETERTQAKRNSDENSVEM
ncbi:uncharacterized protein LOC112464406 [Temnothorax curvispinosus]|uniref:MICOS complex subunit MIC13 n=1 Tax=Temnothorax curvispinosus TaxID=300111 RepID=A0A6J1QZ37_9HYME|nr:uncharacterized protein LOC112464406 [Temnothorax curvispinosus]